MKPYRQQPPRRTLALVAVAAVVATIGVALLPARAPDAHAVARRDSPQTEAEPQ